MKTDRQEHWRRRLHVGLVVAFCLWYHPIAFRQVADGWHGTGLTHTYIWPTILCTGSLLLVGLPAAFLWFLLIVVLDDAK